jgi:hypothetical protein
MIIVKSALKRVMPVLLSVEKWGQSNISINKKAA